MHGDSSAAAAPGRGYTLRSHLAALAAAGWMAAAMAPASPAQEYRGRLGVEAPGDALVDIARESYRWEESDGSGRWSGVGPTDVDEHGWPRVDCRWIVDFRPCAEWSGAIDDPAAYRVDRSGTYHGSFRGRARLTRDGGSFAISNCAYDSASNRTTFDLVVPAPGPQHGLVILGFRDTRRNPGDEPGTGVSEFRLTRPGYPPDTREVFTREYRRCLAGAAFSAIRFMGVRETNGNVEWDKDGPRMQSWSGRKLVADASVMRMEALRKRDGWPWELVIQLCNDSGIDPWINIPVAADDDYIRQLAVLLKRELKDDRAIYIEYSNEIWNFGFIQHAWNKAQAAREVKSGRARYAFDGSASEEIWAQRRHAQRVKDCVDIFAGVFGPAEVNRRVRGILAGVTAEPEGHFVCGRLPGMLEYLRKTGGDPSNCIYAISVPLYYGGQAAAGEAGTERFSVDQILGDMGQTIDRERARRLAVIELARRYHLPGGVCSYEGGPDIGGGRTANIGNRILAVRDPRQGALYKRNFAAGFWDLGGNLAMQFALCSRYNRHGAWGLTDDAGNPDRNSLFAAVRELIGPGPAAPAGGGPER